MFIFPLLPQIMLFLVLNCKKNSIILINISVKYKISTTPRECTRNIPRKHTLTQNARGKHHGCFTRLCDKGWLHCKGNDIGGRVLHWKHTEMYEAGRTDGLHESIGAVSDWRHLSCVRTEALLFFGLARLKPCSDWRIPKYRKFVLSD